MFKSSQGFVGRAGKNTAVISTRRSKPKQNTGFISLNSSMNDNSRGGGGGQTDKSYCFGGVALQGQPRMSSIGSENGGGAVFSNNNNNNNINRTNGGINARTFDPFHDRGKFRTRRVRNDIETEDFERHSSAVRNLLKVVAAPVLNKEVQPTFAYDNSRAFEQALEYYNR